MASLIPDSEKQALSNVFNDLHDTWKREITVYKDKGIIAIGDDINYSAIYGNPAPTPQQVAENKFTIYARILHDKKQNFFKLGGAEEGLKLELDNGGVRIKIDKNDEKVFEGVKRVVLDNNQYEIDTSQRPHGLFEPRFATIYLKRLN